MLGMLTWAIFFTGPSPQFRQRQLNPLGRGGGLVVSVLAFYSDDPSSNPAGYLNFLDEKKQINQKRPGLA